MLSGMPERISVRWRDFMIRSRSRLRWLNLLRCRLRCRTRRSNRRRPYSHLILRVLHIIMVWLEEGWFTCRLLRQRGYIDRLSGVPRMISLIKFSSVADDLLLGVWIPE